MKPIKPIKISGAKVGQVFATRTRVTKANAWMPAVVCVRLEGDPDPKGRLLDVCGWSIGGVGDDVWSVTRLRKYLPKIKQQWFEDYGRSWKLEIR